MRQFPFLVGGVVLLLALGIAWLGAMLGDGDRRLADNWVGPVFVTFVVLLLAVIADSARLQARPSEWDGVVRTPAHEFERATSIFFAGKGWEAQRDDADYKVFVRRNQRLDVGTLGCLLIVGIIPGLLYLMFGDRSGQTVVTLEIYPVMDGTRVRMTQSRGDRSADRFMSALPGLEIGPGGDPQPLGHDSGSRDVPFTEQVILSDEEALERRFDPRHDQDAVRQATDFRIPPREDPGLDPYRDARAWAGYPSAEAFHEDWPPPANPEAARRSAASRARDRGDERKPRRNRGGDR
ncbi:MAG TPA: hypothetical protein VGT61_12650 [Thermomicrobiales bacterium]|jgi:hypothetical protein|nr:hypothetical protein [Thermomicrobiales bacterium]